MFFRHSTDKWLLLMVGAVVLTLVSYHATYHLRGDMPPGFFRPTASNLEQRLLEQKIARAYWESAQNDVQWKYPHGHPLPGEPPPEFRISTQALGLTASDPAVRLVYWHRLQEVWYLPEIWKEQYEWDWGWASDPVASTGQWVKDRLGWR